MTKPVKKLLKKKLKWYKQTLTLYEVNSLFSENYCKTGHEAKSFFKLKNKEHGGDKLKISHWLGPHSRPGLGEAQSWRGASGLADGV